MNAFQAWYEEKKVYLFILLLCLVFYGVYRWDIARYKEALDLANEALKNCLVLPSFE